MIAAGRAPDAFELNYENCSVSFANKGALADLTPLIAADTGFSTSIYNPTALAAFSQGGKQYGLVESFSNVVLFYNKDLFDKAGVAYPTADWTWRTSWPPRKKLTDPARRGLGRLRSIGFWSSPQDHRAERRRGSTPTRPRSSRFPAERRDAAVDDRQGRQIPRHPVDAEMGGQGDNDLFKAGKVAMLRTGIWMFGDFSANAKFNWDIALEPGNTAKAHHFFANGVAVST